MRAHMCRKDDFLGKNDKTIVKEGEELHSEECILHMLLKVIWKPVNVQAISHISWKFTEKLSFENFDNTNLQKLK